MVNASEINIQEIAEKVKSGDQDAFRQFFDAYFDRIYHFLLTILKNPQDAEDVTSVAFIYVWDNRGKLKDSSQLVSWTYQIAKHRAFDHLRKYKGKENVALDEVSEFLPDGGDSPEEKTDNYFKGLVVEEFLARLSLQERALVHLRFVEDLEFKEIARRVGSNSVAVRVRIHRIVKKMQEHGRHNPNGDLGTNPRTKLIL